MNSVEEFFTSTKFITCLVVVLVSYIIFKIIQLLVKRIIKNEANSLKAKRKNTIVVLLNNIFRYLILIIDIVIILYIYGVDVTSMLAGLGIASVIAGLALQDALKDIIMGCNIILDNFFVVGDLVKLNEFTGTVIEFGLKTTKIKAADGTVLIICNREISKIENLNYNTINVHLNIPVAYEEKEEKISKILTDLCKEMDEWEITTDECEYQGIDKLGDSAVEYRITLHSKAGDQFKLRRQALAFIKNEFDKKKVKIPYPQVEVHNGK